MDYVPMVTFLRRHAKAMQERSKEFGARQEGGASPRIEWKGDSPEPSGPCPGKGRKGRKDMRGK